MKTKSVPKSSPLPSSHTPHNLTDEQKREIASCICDRIARGECLTAICSTTSGLPHPNTFFRWTREDPEIAIAYDDARHLRLDSLMVDIMQMANEPVPTCKDARGNVRVDPAALTALKYRVGLKRWLFTVFTAQLEKGRQHHHSEPFTDPDFPSPDSDTEFQSADFNPDVTPTPDEPLSSPSPDDHDPAPIFASEFHPHENTSLYAPNLPSISENPTSEPPPQATSNSSNSIR